MRSMDGKSEPRFSTRWLYGHLLTTGLAEGAGYILAGEDIRSRTRTAGLAGTAAKRCGKQEPEQKPEKAL